MLYFLTFSNQNLINIYITFWFLLLLPGDIVDLCYTVIFFAAFCHLSRSYLHVSQLFTPNYCKYVNEYLNTKGILFLNIKIYDIIYYNNNASQL